MLMLKVVSPSVSSRVSCFGYFYSLITKQYLEDLVHQEHQGLVHDLVGLLFDQVAEQDYEGRDDGVAVLSMGDH